MDLGFSKHQLDLQITKGGRRPQGAALKIQNMYKLQKCYTKLKRKQKCTENDTTSAWTYNKTMGAPKAEKHGWAEAEKSIKANTLAIAWARMI